VLVTGASGGIGRALVSTFAAEGAQVVCLGYRGFDSLRMWLAEQPFAERCLALEADVRASEELEEAFAAALERFGRVDAAVANAGRWPAADVPFHAMDPDRVRRTVEVNLLGAAWTARAFLETLARKGPRDDGHGAGLVFIGSTAGRFGERDHADYAMAKAGLVGLVRSLKNEIVRLDPYGRVNLVEPGWTATHVERPTLHDPDAVRRVTSTMALRQLGRADDVARAVAWLVSPTASRHVTGQTITVAGGMEGRRLWDDRDIDVAHVHARLAPDDEARTT
jgi:3-oxoacyl-[acyl-carrier protein] reductase